MNLIYKKIGDIIPYKNNPRKNANAVKYVKESIEEFGFKVPIIIDSNNEIIAGHTRLEASKQLGYTEVPCIVADDLTEEQVKQFRLIDNKVNEYALWDYGKIFDELDSILKIDMAKFGFEKEIDNLGEFEYSGDEELEDYQEPEHDQYCCPNCQHKDRKIHFIKVKE